MSMLNNRSVLFVLTALMLGGIGDAGNAASLTVQLPEAGSLSITTQAGKAHVSSALGASTAGARAVLLDGPLARELARASEVVSVGGDRGVLQGGRTFLVLGVAIPSVAKPGDGFCGAGTEDFLLLVEWKARPSKLELRDRLRVQSCIQSMELQSEQGSDLRTVLRSAGDPANFTLTWLQHSRYGPSTKTVTLFNGKFAVAP